MYLIFNLSNGVEKEICNENTGAIDAFSKYSRVLFAAAMFSNAHDGLSNAASGMVVTAAADQADTDVSGGENQWTGGISFSGTAYT